MGDEDVRVPFVHGDAGLLDRGHLDEYRRLACVRGVVSTDEADPALEVGAEREPDRGDAVVEGG